MRDAICNFLERHELLSKLLMWAVVWFVLAVLAVPEPDYATARDWTVDRFLWLMGVANVVPLVYYVHSRGWWED